MYRREYLAAGAASAFTIGIAGCFQSTDSDTSFNEDEATEAYYEAIAADDWDALSEAVHDDSDLMNAFDMAGSSGDDWGIAIRGGGQELIQDFDELDVVAVEAEVVSEFDDVRDVKATVTWENYGQETEMTEELEFRRDGSDWAIWDANPDLILDVYEELGPCPASYEQPHSYVARQAEHAADRTYGHLRTAYIISFFTEDGKYVHEPEDIDRIVVQFPEEIQWGNYHKTIVEYQDAVDTVERNKSEIEDTRNVVHQCSTPDDEFVLSILDDIQEKAEYYLEATKAFISALETLAEYDGDAEFDQYEHTTTLPGPESAQNDLLEGLENLVAARKVDGVPSDLEAQLEVAARD
ncbi:hypothetical protein [Natrinema sp. SYSU A 869]|uniref:hypothetical protein n=1 Tax=Natrinema sp. SYSU A 869 TaxID=2871694 RepID=UPI001CA434E1|nr:hypothetical protein [Natrinema sp. SYSU A 869]